MKPASLGSKYVVAVLDTLLVQSLFSAWLVMELLEEGGGLTPDISIPGLPLSLLSSPKTWYAACALVTFVTVTSSFASLLLCSWALFLLFLRVAMIEMVVNKTVSRMTITIGHWSLPPYALLSLACYGLLWLLYGSEQRRRGSRKPTKAASAGLAGLRSASMSTLRPSVSEPAVTDKFAGLDTALEALSPQTPLTTRYTDLNGANRSHSGRSSPFGVPNLRLTKNTVATTPKPTVDLRPSVFDGTRQVGLESVLEGFSIDEARPRTSSSLTSARSGAVLDKIVLTAGCVMARIALNEQLALIAVLLILAIGLRDVMWRRLPTSMRVAINALALGRLFWIVLLFNNQLFADWPALHERINGLEYIMDMLIVLTR